MFFPIFESGRRAFEFRFPPRVCAGHTTIFFMFLVTFSLQALENFHRAANLETSENSTDLTGRMYLAREDLTTIYSITLVISCDSHVGRGVGSGTVASAVSRFF